MDLVSIITPLYNSEDFISETINSVLNQSYKNWELILIDDRSTDSSYEIVMAFSKADPRISVIQLDVNSGAAAARNIGIARCLGRYIAFIDSDDAWFPDKLSKQIAFMQDNNYHLTYTAYERITEDGQFINDVGVPATVDYTGLLKTNVMGCFTVIYDVEYFGKVLMPSILKRQDFGLWLQLLKTTKNAFGINEVLGRYRVRENSLSANKFNAAKYNWEIYRNIENLSFLKSLYYFSHYAIKGLLRTKFPKLAKLLGILL